MAVTTAAGPDQDDDDKNLTILEHLRELRYRVMVSGGALLLCMIVSFYPITGWVLRWLKKPAEGKVDNFTLVFTQPLEYWSTFFSVALMVGLAMSMPVIVYQILAFVGPGLTRTEKRWIYPIVIGASVMFVLGCLFAYYIELPPALNFLLDGQGVAATVHLREVLRQLRHAHDDGHRPGLRAAAVRHGPRQDRRRAARRSC